MELQTIVATQFVNKVIPYVNRAKNSIDICVFDWRWYPNDPGAACQQFNQSIVSAVRRGVKVRALVNSESVAQILRSVGVECKKHASSHLLHLKMMLIDDKIVITGSHNYTQSAFTTNYELSVVLSEVDSVSEFSNFFINLWQNH